jgi:hypothetical protein
MPLSVILDNSVKPHDEQGKRSENQCQRKEQIQPDFDGRSQQRASSLNDITKILYAPMIFLSCM